MCLTWQRNERSAEWTSVLLSFQWVTTVNTTLTGFVSHKRYHLLRLRTPNDRSLRRFLLADTGLLHLCHDMWPAHRPCASWRAAFWVQTSQIQLSLEETGCFHYWLVLFLHQGPSVVTNCWKKICQDHQQKCQDWSLGMFCTILSSCHHAQEISGPNSDWPSGISTSNFSHPSEFSSSLPNECLFPDTSSKFSLSVREKLKLNFWSINFL